jgi:SNF2 family DNA or RNA helicase
MIYWSGSMIIHADLTEDGKSIWVTFEYDQQTVYEIKSIPGFRFVGPDKGGPAWRTKVDFETCRTMRNYWGDSLIFTKRLTDWGRKIGSRQHNLRELHTTADVELPVLEARLPDLAKTLRPYQRVGSAFVAAEGSHPLVADMPRTGKTRTVISGLFEAGIPDSGPVLVVAPLTALETVWLRELNELQDLPVFVPWGNRDQRMDVLEDLLVMKEEGLPYWLIVNPAMIQYRRKGYDEQEKEILEPSFPQIMEIDWAAVVADEVHKAAMGNTQALTAKAFYDLRCHKRVAMSGTPLGGMPVKLYGILHWLHPDTFTSKWKFVDQWLYVEEIPTRRGTFKKIGKVRPNKQEGFDHMMQAYMLRRTRQEVAPDVKEADQEHVYIEMGPKQARQYKQMALEAEVRIEDMLGVDPDLSDKITAQGVLAEYTRLKQFANAFCTLGDMQPNNRRKVIPTPDSNKLRALLEYLEERGITAEDYDDETGEKVVVGSQYSETVDMVAEYLQEHLSTAESKKAGEIRCDKLTGATPGIKRKDVIGRFQSPLGSRVLCMTTTAGGVAIDLSRADTVIVLDETWNPDDQRQLVDRVISLQDIRAKSVIYIHSRDTIEDYVRSVNLEKEGVNITVLDAWRASYRKAAGLEGAA